MEVKKCIRCGTKFTFDTRRCSQVIYRKEGCCRSISFLPRCSNCGESNSVQLDWDSYGALDY